MNPPGLKRRKLDDAEVASSPSTPRQPLFPTSANVNMPILSSSAEDAVPEPGEESICSICFSPWTTDGAHRICSVPCGHIFGRSCVEKWIQTQKSCPQCKVKCTIKELRNLFVNKIIAMDSIERNQLREALSAEKIQRAKAEQQCSQLQSQLRGAEMRYLLLKADHDKFLGSRAASASSSSSSDGKFYFHPALKNSVRFDSLTSTHQFNVPLSKSRVLEYVAAERWLLASTQLSNPQRFGVRRFSTLDAKGFHDDIDIGHSEAIRDIKSSPHDSKVILTVSTDRSVRLTNVQSKNCVLAIQQQGAPFWSCCWDTKRLNYCYCGTQTGSVFVFDIRQTKSAVITLTAQHLEPIHSLHYATAPGLDSSWLISGSMGGIYGWNTTNMFEALCLDYSSFFPAGSQFKCLGLDFADSGSVLLSTFRASNPNTPDNVLACRVEFGNESGLSTEEPKPEDESNSSINISFGGSELPIQLVDATTWTLPSKSTAMSRPSICYTKTDANRSEMFLGTIPDESIRGVRIFSPSSGFGSAPVSQDQQVLDSKLVRLDSSMTKLRLFSVSPTGLNVSDVTAPKTGRPSQVPTATHEINKYIKIV